MDDDRHPPPGRDPGASAENPPFACRRRRAHADLAEDSRQDYRPRDSLGHLALQYLLKVVKGRCAHFRAMRGVDIEARALDEVDSGALRDFRDLFRLRPQPDGRSINYRLPAGLPEAAEPVERSIGTVEPQIVAERKSIPPYIGESVGRYQDVLEPAVFGPPRAVPHRAINQHVLMRACDT